MQVTVADITTAYFHLLRQEGTGATGPSRCLNVEVFPPHLGRLSAGAARSAPPGGQVIRQVPTRLPRVNEVTTAGLDPAGRAPFLRRLRITDPAELSTHFGEPHAQPPAAWRDGFSLAATRGRPMATGCPFDVP